MDNRRKLLGGLAARCLVIVALLLAGTGCLESSAVTCADGSLCGDGRVCLPNGGCADPDDVVVCDGLSAGDACASTFGEGICRDGACAPARCGDGVVDSVLGEVCDDGNRESADGCRSDCRSDERCGNGVLDIEIGEACDDGPGQSHDGCSSLCSLEIPRWTERDDLLRPRNGHAMVYDPTRQVVVMYGGGYDETWEFDGATWTRIMTAHSPGVGYGLMTFEAARDTVLLITPDTTWRYDGLDWTPAAAVRTLGTDFAIGPTVAVAYDSARGVSVAFSLQQSDDNPTFQEIYSWELTDDEWIPTSMTYGQFVAGGWATYDPASGSVALLLRREVFGQGALQLLRYQGGQGGGEPGGSFTEQPTSSYDDSLTPGTGSLVYDSVRERIVLVQNNQSTYGGLVALELEGSSWIARDVDPVSSANAMAVFAPVLATGLADGIVVVGNDQNATVTRVLTNSEVSWRVATASWMPSATIAIADDRAHGTVVAVVPAATGARTLTFVATDWQPQAAAPSANAVITYADHLAAVVGSFNGDTNLRRFDHETGTWQVLPNTSVVPAGSSGLTYDRARQRVIAAAGGRLLGFNEVTGSWDELATTTTGEGIGKIVYDERRDLVVAFGGGENILGNRTWIYDGVTLTQLPTTAERTPSPRRDARLVYDPMFGQVLLINGTGNNVIFTDMWAFNGTGWDEVPSSRQPPAGLGPIAFDAIRQALVGVANGTTWEFARRDRDTRDEACTSADDDVDGDGLAGCDDPDCWGRCAPNCPPGTSCPDDAPRCGDGLCAAVLEDATLCPSDC